MSECFGWCNGLRVLSELRSEPSTSRLGMFVLLSCLFEITPPLHGSDKTQHASLRQQKDDSLARTTRSVVRNEMDVPDTEIVDGLP